MKFVLVASWYMHLRTDKPIFRRFFMLGIVAAIMLYMIVLTTFHVFWRLSAVHGRCRRLPGWQPHPTSGCSSAAARRAVRDRRRPRRAPVHGARRRRGARGSRSMCFALGVLAIWVAADWPIHDVAERYIYSVAHGAAPRASAWSPRRCCCSERPAWLLREILRPPSLLVPRRAPRLSVPARAASCSTSCSCSRTGRRWSTSASGAAWRTSSSTR